MPCDYVAHCYALYYFIIYYGINDPLFSFLFSIVQYIPEAILAIGRSGRETTLCTDQK